MMFTSLLIIALATLVDCQAVTHIVNVGAVCRTFQERGKNVRRFAADIFTYQDGFNFSPSQLAAGIGDIIGMLKHWHLTKSNRV